MATPTFDAASSSTTLVAGVMTWSHTVDASADGMIIAASPRSNATAVASILWNGSATGVSQIAARNDGAGELRMELWQIIAPASGTHNIVLTWADLGTSFAEAEAVSLIGTHQTTPVTASASNSDVSGTTGSGAGSITVNVASSTSELVVGAAFQSTGSNTFTSAGTGQTERVDANDGAQISGTMATQDGASTTTHAYTGSGNKEWIVMAASVQGVGGGATSWGPLIANRNNQLMGV